MLKWNNYTYSYFKLLDIFKEFWKYIWKYSSLRLFADFGRVSHLTIQHSLQKAPWNAAQCCTVHWSLSSFRAAGIKDRPSKAIFGCWLRRRSTYMNSAISSQMLRLAVPPPWKKYHGCKTTPSTSPVVSTWSRNIQSTELGTIQFVSAFFSTKYRTTSCLPPSTSNDVKYTIHRKSLSLSLSTFYAHLICDILLSELH